MFNCSSGQEGKVRQGNKRGGIQPVEVCPTVLQRERKGLKSMCC